MVRPHQVQPAQERRLGANHVTLCQEASHLLYVLDERTQLAFQTPLDLRRSGSPLRPLRRSSVTTSGF